MASRSLVKKNAYYDSVTLMIITREIESMADVENAVVVMGTEHNKELLSNVGLLNEETAAANPSDLVIAVRLKDEKLFDQVVEKVESLLTSRKANSGEDYSPATLEGARKVMPDANLALISLPGQYAAEAARDALAKGMHVMLFSDNVSIEQEKMLKTFAVEKGLLMMGPDCGTAYINQIPLAFANKVHKGNIGIVGASGTGTQEIMVQIDRFGGGVSQAIGTGGRDLKAEIGGLMMMEGIKALGADDATEVIVLVSKPPAHEIAEKVLALLKECGKKAVVDFIGGDERMIRSYGFIPASTLEDAAYKAVMLAGGQKAENLDTAPLFSDSIENINKQALGEAKKLTAKQKYLRGLFSGGTLCDEALKLFAKQMGPIYSNIPLSPEFRLPEKKLGFKDSAVDLGDDEFTVGRPHPMIDSYTRQQAIVDQSEDEEIAVLLMDVVLGYGSNADPAGSLVNYIQLARKRFEERGQYLCVVTGICGTSEDPQGYDEQVKKLEEAGAIVMPSNAQAVRFAMKVLQKAGIQE